MAIEKENKEFDPDKVRNEEGNLNNKTLMAAKTV